MNKRNWGPVLLGAFVIFGCASIDINTSAVPTLKAGASVEIGRDAVAAVGSVVYSEFNYYSAQGAITRVAFARPVAPFGRIAVPAGTRLLETTVDGQPAYCSSQRTFFAPGEARSLCFFDPNKSGIFGQAYVVGTLASLRYDVLVPYATEEISTDSVGYKYELLYQGKAGDVIKLSYREYNNNFARPAFQQDLSYTLTRGTPTEISFRGVRMLVLGADNNGIRYRIISGFSKT